MYLIIVNDHSGEPSAEKSQDIMDAAHSLLQAESIDQVRLKLGELSVDQYLDTVWVSAHPNVRTAIANVEEQLQD